MSHNDSELEFFLRKVLVSLSVVVAVLLILIGDILYRILKSKQLHQHHGKTKGAVHSFG